MTPTWLHVDLLAHFVTGQIETNVLSNYSDFARISRSLSTILLNNMDIEKIASTAFGHFFRLRTLNLAQNNIKHVQLAAFSFVYVPQLANGTANETSQLGVDGDKTG